MSDMGDDFREHKEYMRNRKEREGIDCPGCLKVQPKRIPSRLLPGWVCKVCGYHRPTKQGLRDATRAPNAAKDMP